jgi:hypothetical protein
VDREGPDNRVGLVIEHQGAANGRGIAAEMMITLVAAAFVPTLLQARRAASIDPTEALRQE